MDRSADREETPTRYLLVGYSAAGKSQYIARGYDYLKGGVDTGRGVLSVTIDHGLEDVCGQMSRDGGVAATADNVRQYSVNFTLDGRVISRIVVEDMRGGNVMDNPASVADRLARPDVGGAVCVYSCRAFMDGADGSPMEYDRKGAYSTANLFLQQSLRPTMTLFSWSDALYLPRTEVCDLRERILNAFPGTHDFGDVVFSSSNPECFNLYSPAVWFRLLSCDLRRKGRKWEWLVGFLEDAVRRDVYVRSRRGDIL